MPVLSVIIPALNEAHNVGRAVTSALHGGADEVLVVDGGSSDATAKHARVAGAKVVVAERGRARQMNVGAGAARGDVLLFLHADNWLADSALAQLREALTSDTVGCGAFRQQIMAPGWPFRVLERGNAARVRFCGLAYGDQAIFVRRSLFDACGGYPDVRLLEDLILMRRLRWRCWPRLLDGPVHISPRRWQQQGIVRQTLRNWCIVGAYFAGASPDHLARYYYRPDHRLREPS